VITALSLSICWTNEIYSKYSTLGGHGILDYKKDYKMNHYNQEIYLTFVVLTSLDENIILLAAKAAFTGLEKYSHNDQTCYASRYNLITQKIAGWSPRPHLEGKHVCVLCIYAYKYPHKAYPFLPTPTVGVKKSLQLSMILAP